MAFMYLLECADRSFYTGSTHDVAARFRQHQRGEGGGSSYTESRRPVRLVYYEEYERIEDAYDREQQVKAMLRGRKRRLVASGSGGVRPDDPSRPFPWMVT